MTKNAVINEAKNSYRMITARRRRPASKRVQQVVLPKATQAINEKKSFYHFDEQRKEDERMRQEAEKRAEKERIAKLERIVIKKNEEQAGKGIPLCECKRGSALPVEKPDKQEMGQSPGFSTKNKQGKELPYTLPSAAELVDLDEPKPKRTVEYKNKMRSLETLPARGVVMDKPPRLSTSLLNQTKRGLAPTRFPSNEQKTYQAKNSRDGIVNYNFANHSML